jgi:molecular chaperone DnaK
VLAGEVTDILLLDVTPLSLGVETLGGVFTKIIDRNTTIPTKKSQIFTTAADMQTSVTIHILQGERAMAQDNVSLGNFNLTGIPPAPRGVPQIEVTFDIDANGLLNVSAKDLATGKQTGITITASTKLSDKEKDRMVKEAEQYAEADKKKKEEAEIRNQADSLIYAVEKTKSDLKDKISSEMITKLDNASKELKDAMSGTDIEAIKQKSEALGNVLKEVGTMAYQQASASAAQGSGGTSDQAGQKVVDAEYKVDEEGKKSSG